MKKNIFIISTIFTITYLLFINYQYLSDTVIISSYLFISKILPFFIPIFIISKLLINYNLPYYISKLFNNNIYVYILVISFFIGCPSNIILINDLLTNNIINEKEANTYIKCTFFINPLFLYSILSAIFNQNTAILIIIIEILSNIIIYLIKPIKNTKTAAIKSTRLIDTINKSINDMINPLEIIYITIIIFNIIILLIPNKLINFIGIIEITKGLNFLITYKTNQFYKLLLCIIYISFGGISIHIQVKYLLNQKLKYSSFFIGRILQIIISIILITLYYRIITIN